MLSISYGRCEGELVHCFATSYTRFADCEVFGLNWWCLLSYFAFFFFFLCVYEMGGGFWDNSVFFFSEMTEKEEKCDLGNWVQCVY